MKSDKEFEKIDQRSVCSHYALFMRAYTNPTWLKKETPHLLAIQNTTVLFGILHRHHADRALLHRTDIGYMRV